MIIFRCNICKSDDATEETYDFPMWLDARGGLGSYVLMPKVSLDKCKVNLCPSCKKKLADMIYHT
jgi:hypothetical protein